MLLFAVLNNSCEPFYSSFCEVIESYHWRDILQKGLLDTGFTYPTFKFGFLFHVFYQNCCQARLFSSMSGILCFVKIVYLTLLTMDSKGFVDFLC